MSSKKPQIDPEKYYTPKECVKIGVTTAKDTQVLLRHARAGKIPETLNLGSEKRPRYAFKGKHLIEYRNGQMAGKYETK